MKKMLPFAALLLSPLALLLLAGAGSARAAGPQMGVPANNVYICVDAQGRRLTSDRPLPECVDREQRVLSATGIERPRIGPTLTAKEREALEAKQRQEIEERQRILEERRRERALVARYPNQSAHDAERQQALDHIDQLTAVAQMRIADLQSKRTKFDTEMEFYKKDPNKAPMYLRRALAENQDNITEQQRFIAAQAQEKRRIHQRFDVELIQLQKLWAERARNQAVDTPSKP